MIIVDDRLSLYALAGRPEVFGGRPEDAVATTWGFHFRLVRALTDTSRVGALSEPGQSADMLAMAIAPSPQQLQVVDPRQLTEAAAKAAVRHGLNLLAAELVAAAAHHGATIALSQANIGRTWPTVFRAEGIELHIVS